MEQAMIDRLERSFNLLAPRGPELVDRFYAHLFSKHPALRPMFPSDMGERHVGYGTATEHYPVVRDTLVSVMAEMAGEAWNDQLTQDWNGALDFVASVMLEGAESATPAGPPN